jgi:hemolysin activation/secretion protein
VEGTRHFSKEYFIERISRRSGPPFRIGNLQEAFQLLYQDQRITAINAELAGGLAPGESSLNLRVAEASPWQLTLSATNDNSPSIGSYHGGLTAAHRNLTGYGDTLEAGFGGSEGGYDYGARYSRPITSADTMLDIYFRRSEATVIDPLFRPLDITSSSASYGGRISHPLVRGVRREIRPSLSGEYRESFNYLLGEGFSFSSHEKNGQNSFSVLRPGLEWIERRDGLVVVGSTVFSTGITEESFAIWLGRMLWMQRTGLWASRIHLRGEAQLADTGLPPMEKYALGGINSVRGYRKNVLVKDNGMNASLEWWFPLIRDNVSGSEYFSVAPFFDYGRGWDSGQETADANRATDLASIGVGLRWAWKGLSVDFFYGYGLLKSGITVGSAPQEQGVHFAVTWNVL